ncbi:hypothetical protein [Microbispora sp. NBRC 16548]|uniref:alpha/beta fold hydrolase n=1 Tax=Microbispora sp. NBRC 16548 TaxID=3030994 RepID=UPI0016149039|nr:hypothetical protein [Microbispora sp. NBRC 16548]GLX03410.1 hypothetical protein Misp03_03370 [Microbispora sp. NBRC 16548]
MPTDRHEAWAGEATGRGPAAPTPVGHSEAIACALPSARLVVLPSGHNLMLERPLGVNAALGRLLRLVTRPEPALRELSAAC